MEYPVTIMLVSGPDLTGLLLTFSSPGTGTTLGIRRKSLFFIFLEHCTDKHPNLLNPSQVVKVGTRYDPHKKLF
jgi:hypothetical protein